jgi:NADH-quinone oxidoreductase subunit H
VQTFLDNSLFRNIYCNLVENDSARCAAGGWFGGGLLPNSLAWLAFAITGAAIAFVILNGVLGAVIGFIWAERRIVARFQSRSGPNRWGPFGTLTPVADAIKTMFKEDVVPAEADRLVFNLAPVFMVVPVFLVFAVIPFGIGTFAAGLNIGLLFVIAVTSGSVLAIVMAAYGSGNRLSIFAGMRAVALLISYEIPMALSVIGVVMLAGSLSMGEIIEAQDVPFIIVQPLGFLVFFLAALAEMGRTPFDLAEAESELSAGYINDYSSMKFGLFYLAEFAAALAASAVIVTVFLSGWRGWAPVPSFIWFFLKMGAVLFTIMWIRFTWPRLRADQIMALAWKGLFELTLVNLVATAVLVAIWPQPTTSQLWTMAAVNWAIFFASVWVIGRVIVPGPAKEAVTPMGPVYPVGVDEKPAAKAAGAAG